MKTSKLLKGMKKIVWLVGLLYTNSLVIVHFWRVTNEKEMIFVLYIPCIFLKRLAILKNL